MIATILASISIALALTALALAVTTLIVIERCGLNRAEIEEEDGGADAGPH